MPIGPNGQKRPADVVSNAVQVMKALTGEADDTSPANDGQDKAAQALGRKGGAARGKVMASPPSSAGAPDALFGCLKSQTLVPADFDLTAPLAEDPMSAASTR